MNNWFVYVICGVIAALPVFIIAQEADEENDTPEYEIEGYIHSVDNVNLYYRVAGSGPDTLVVIHGGPGLSIYYLAPDLESLTEKYTVIYYDQRSAGRSTMVIDSASLHIDRYLADLEEVRRYFGIDRMTLLGHSWGAVLGARYVRAYPDNVELLIMVSPGPIRYDPYDAMFFPRVTAWMDSTLRDEMESLHKKFVSGEGDILAVCHEFTDLFKRGYFYDPFDLETFGRMRGDICSAPEPALRNTWTVNALTLQSIGEWDWRDDYQDIDIPVHVITGMRDVFPVENFQEWEAAFPNSQLVLLERAGHYPHVERPEKFFRQIWEILDDD
jgi:proline iminopeptidase